MLRPSVGYDHASWRSIEFENIRAQAITRQAPGAQDKRIETGKAMDQNAIGAAIAEASKLGVVSSTEWQSYTWKNELAEQNVASSSTSQK
jgi:hypothetical protein